MENLRSRRHQDHSADSILPAQFYPPRRRSQQAESLKRLMVAILEQAVKCFQANHDARGGEKRREFLEAQWWLFKADGARPFSFENVCEALGVHPDYLRRTLSQWLNTKLSATAAAGVRENTPSPALELRRTSRRLRLLPPKTASPR